LLACALYDPDGLDRLSIVLEYCSYVQYNNDSICGVYKPLSGTLSARLILVDETQATLVTCTLSCL